MAGMSSRPISERVLFAQDSEPTTERDGLVWVDTSDPERPVFVYSGDSQQWEPVFDKRVYAHDTEPDDERDGNLWVDTSDPDRTTYVFSGDSQQWEPVSTDFRTDYETWLASESGTYETDAHNSTVTVELTERYDPEHFTASAGWSVDLSGTDDGRWISTRVEGVTLDGAGHVDGIEIRHHRGSASNAQRKVTWWAKGLKA